MFVDDDSNPIALYKVTWFVMILHSFFDSSVFSAVGKMLLMIFITLEEVSFERQVVPPLLDEPSFSDVQPD